MSSPHRDRDRHRDRRHSRSRSRDRKIRPQDLGRPRSRDRARSRDRIRGDSDRVRRHRSPLRNRSRSPRTFDGRRTSRDRSRDRKSNKCSRDSHKRPQAAQPKKEICLVDLTSEEQEMMSTMGFCTFDTTKGKKVEGNDVGAVHTIVKRKYRQYMNRKGGFNRPLDFVA